ncbi:hypothetical protein B0H13DRAFT_1874419 [Mycena leptocephala]|nr:hypothetical protein B0H13DRAFT_1874419 [Mycena leptocephala]
MPKQDQNIRVSAHQLMDFRDHVLTAVRAPMDNDSWDLGGGGGRAKVSAHACETLDPALRTTVHFELQLNSASRDAIIAALQETRRREGNYPGPEERVTVFMEIICDAKCLAVDSTRSQAPTERKQVADEDISARPPKRTARS